MMEKLDKILMVEKKFNVSSTFQPEQYIEDIIVKIREISGVEMNLHTLKPQVQVPGYNVTTYVLKGGGIKVSVRYDPDAVRVQRPGLGLYISADNEEQICKAIVEILGMNGQSS